MDKTVPPGAALLLDFIYRTEVGKGAPACYNVIFGNRQSRLAKQLTAMTPVSYTHLTLPTNREV